MPSTGLAAPQFRNAEVMDRVYRSIEEADRDYSRELGVKESVKLTTVKPSGTLSLLPYGVTPGMHAAFSRRMIRRIRFAASDPLVAVCGASGYPVEPLKQLDGSDDHSVAVVSFPMSFPDHVTTEDQVTAIDELELQRFLQSHWADHSVSATHYYRQDELPEIRLWPVGGGVHWLISGYSGAGNEPVLLTRRNGRPAAQAQQPYLRLFPARSDQRNRGRLTMAKQASGSKFGPAALLVAGCPAAPERPHQALVSRRRSVVSSKEAHGIDRAIAQRKLSGVATAPDASATNRTADR